VAIFWSNPAVSPFIQTRIVRKVGSFPMSPKDGEIIFEGKSQTFTDTEVTNDREYHYAIYTHNLGRKYSPPVLLSMVPTDGVEQYTVKAPLLRNRTATVTSPFSHDLVFGMTDSDVRALQRLLSQDTSLYPEGAVTGYFGPLTLAAVKRTQERYDLPQTGIVDASTRNALLHLVDPITSVPHAVAWDHDLAKGAQGDDVKALQQLLINEDVFPEKLVTGYFRILTQQALTRFQRKYNLPTTGILDQTTRAQIRSMKNQ
jgi:peptidoglycan hydrolase-like protein with peptidoglycan-binding domain